MTQRKREIRRHYRQIAFVSFFMGFLLTLIYQGGQAKAMPSTVTPSGVETTPTPVRAGTGVTAVEGKLTLRYEIENYIKQKFGKDGERAVKIVKCESGMNPDAINLNKGHSLDRGLWQINAKFHPEVTHSCAFDAKCATDAAFRIYQAHGKSFKAWACSRKV